MDTPGRLLALVEVGTGYVFLAVVIGYLPVLYQAFANREATISLLDARAGSPPTAGQFLARLAPTRDIEVLRGFLADWERWSAELLESHLSFPMLAFYRSQHDNQSWLATLTFILDTSSLVIAGLEGFEPYQSRLTFAMARHAAVDLAQTLRTAPPETVPDRLPGDRMHRLWDEPPRGGPPPPRAPRPRARSWPSSARCTSRSSPRWPATSGSTCPRSGPTSRRSTTGSAAPG